MSGAVRGEVKRARITRQKNQENRCIQTWTSDVTTREFLVTLKKRVFVKYAHSAAAVLTRPKPSRWAECCAACARRRGTETREAMMSRSGCKESKVASGAFIIPSQHNHTPSERRVYTQTERLSSQSIARVSWHRIYSGELLTSSTRQRNTKQHGEILRHTRAAKGIITKQNEELNLHHISFFFLKLFHCLFLARSKQTINCAKLIQALCQWAVGFFGGFFLTLTSLHMNVGGCTSLTSFFSKSWQSGYVEKWRIAAEGVERLMMKVFFWIILIMLWYICCKTPWSQFKES